MRVVPVPDASISAGDQVAGAAIGAGNEPPTFGLVRLQHYFAGRDKPQRLLPGSRIHEQAVFAQYGNGRTSSDVLSRHSSQLLLRSSDAGAMHRLAFRR